MLWENFWEAIVKNMGLMCKKRYKGGMQNVFYSNVFMCIKSIESVYKKKRILFTTFI